MKAKHHWIIAATLATTALLGAPLASAELVGGLTYHRAEWDNSNLNVDYNLDLISGTVGYRFNSTGSSFSLIPQLRLGTGIGDDTDRGITLEVNHFYGIDLRGQWELNSGFYVFAAPTYTNFDIDLSSGPVSASGDEWEFGGGGGVGFRISNNASLELSYEAIDDIDMLGIGARMSF